MEDMIMATSDSESDCDDVRIMTAEEIRRYDEMIKASDGFDVEYVPADVELMGIIMSMDIKCCEDGRYIPFADLALVQYNHLNGTNLKCAKVLKVNSQVVNGSVYYITFEVKQHQPAWKTWMTRWFFPKKHVIIDDSPNQIFQAKVLEGIRNTEVYLCRPKPLN